MAEASVPVQLLAPDKAPVSFEASELVVPGLGGVFTVQAGHTPLLSVLLPGVLEVRNGDASDFYALHGGFAEVTKDGVSILADAYEHSDHIDRERAEAAKERAQERLRKRPEDLNVQRAEAALARSFARLHAHAGEGYE